MMASAIDPTKPTSGTATTESVRANFAAAKSEIEALQAALAAVPQGIGSLTMTAGETLATRDVAVLGADLKVYKATGGAAVATETTTLPNPTSIGSAYNHATGTIVLVYRDTSVITQLRIVSGTVNSDGTVTLGAGFTVAGIGSAQNGVLDVCHVTGDMFFTCWRSSSTEMSALAFLANGTTASAPQAKTTWATTSSTTGYTSGVTVAYDPVSSRIFAAAPAVAADPCIHSWGAWATDCVLGFRDPISVGAIVYSSGWAALVPHEGFLYWLTNNNSTYADNAITTLRVIDCANLTVSAPTAVTGTLSTAGGRNVAAHAHVKVGSSLYLAVIDHGTSTNYSSTLAIKELQLDAGAVTLPGGLTAATTLLVQGSLTLGSSNNFQSGSLGYDAQSGKLVAGVRVSTGTAHAYKTLELSTGAIDPAGTAANSFYTAATSNGFWFSRAVSHPTQGILFFRNVTSNSSGLIWNLKPSRPTNLTSVSYMGFVKDAAAANAPVTVLTSGAIVGGFEGLTPLSTYYALPANTISTVQGADGVQAGVAISPTQLMLRS